jgi:alpha-ketoglutarate-dependent taurine dioxygenase
MTTVTEITSTRRALEPFGIEIRAEGSDSSIVDLNVGELMRLVAANGVVVLRGFASMPKKDELVSFARRFGDLLEWNFGHVLDLFVHEEPRNYLFTHGEVPFHWDGAFAARTPSLQVFQCLRSPGPGSGGETTFCDTTRVIRDAGSAELRRWENISIRYQTEKVAHYGGEIMQRLVEAHPADDSPILRFAEPVDGLNPLFLEIDGLEGETQEEFLRRFTPRLYAAHALYAHEWREGDFVIADNHRLIHGRNAFRTNAARHIQRIHVL